MDFPEYTKYIITAILTILTGFFTWYGIVHDFKDKKGRVTKQGNIAVIGAIVTMFLNVFNTYLDIKKENKEAANKAEESRKDDITEKERQNELLESIDKTLSQQKIAVQKVDTSIEKINFSLEEQKRTINLLDKSVGEQKKSIDIQLQEFKLSKRLLSPIPKEIYASIVISRQIFDEYSGVPNIFGQYSSISKDSIISIDRSLIDKLKDSSYLFTEFIRDSLEFEVKITRADFTKKFILEQLPSEYKSKKFTILSSDSRIWLYNKKTKELIVHVFDIPLKVSMESSKIISIEDLRNASIRVYRPYSNYSLYISSIFLTPGLIDKTHPFAIAEFKPYEIYSKLALFMDEE